MSSARTDVKKPEILAPAGDFTCLQAAIDAGADAVYFGLGTFNMRARSGVNFKLEDLPEIARRCELGSDRVGIGSDRVGIGSDKVGIGSDRVGIGSDKVGIGSDRVGIGSDRVSRGSNSGVSRSDSKVSIRRYLTLNAIMFEGEMDEVEKTIVAAKAFVDAFIVSDWGVISLCQKHGARFHVSTQMSTSNSAAVEFLAAQGAERVVLARECTLAEVAQINQAIKRSNSPAIELECFVHGAQCVAESGRCFMSHDVFGKSACRGECKQPCRRRFLVKAVDLYEDDEGKPVHESDTAFVVEPHTVLSAKDLCSLGFVDKLMAAGIASFKIEGRARNANYVKTVVTAYRRAVDAVADGTYTPELVAELTELVKTVFHREFADGLYFGRPGADQFTDSEDSMATTVKRHIGIVIDYFLKAGIAQIKVQDHAIATGDAIQIHGPTTGVLELTAGDLYRDELKVEKCEKGDWITVKCPRCRVGDKVFFVEKR